MSRLLFFVVFLLGGGSLVAQDWKEYTEDPLYWGNRKPRPDYWQQDVHYRIQARVDEQEHRIDGKQQLYYINHSGDTLTEIYLRLFQNAFNAGSHLRELERINKVSARLGPREAKGEGTLISLLQQEGQDLEVEQDNTILKVALVRPLPPGGSIRLDIEFQTFFDDQGSTRRRMKMYDAWGMKHYNGVQWFPKVCVYDPRSGWDLDQHLNKEFYGEYGTYEVDLDFPSNYVVEATGVLQNRSEVLPDSLRERLDLKHFVDKPWGEAPSTIIPYVPGERKVWKFKALHVHDFAFTADPSYRIDTRYWNGVECVALVQEPHASGWKNAAEYTARTIETFSRDFGPYHYPKMVVADAADGMEYPMITLDGGADPGYRGLLVHEIGHNWFYGMVGSNETYRAALDEGFTQFLTAWGLEAIDGPELVQNPRKRKYFPLTEKPAPPLAREVRVFSRYVLEALKGQELSLLTHSNEFRDALRHEGGYAMVYYKPAVMLYHLQYVLGDSLFMEAMRAYVDQWKFAHPYIEDFRNTITQVTGQNLNWFFDQWFESTKTLDYAITGVKKVKGKKDHFRLQLKRKGDMQTPLDIRVTSRDQQTHDFHVPNTWFRKEDSATTLPRWYSIGGLHRHYEAELEIPGGIETVELDPSGRLADLRPWDNRYQRAWAPFRGAISYHLGRPDQRLDRHHYRFHYYPDLWYNRVDGLKLGLRFEGSFMRSVHKLNGGIWWNTHWLQAMAYWPEENEGHYDRFIPWNYSISWENPLSSRWPSLQLGLSSRLMEGMWKHKAGLRWTPEGLGQFSFYFQTFWRPYSYDLAYLIYPMEWSSFRGRPNQTLNLGWTRDYRWMKGEGTGRLAARAPAPIGWKQESFDYAYVEGEWIHRQQVGEFLWNIRLFGRWGTGRQLPYESLLFLAGANNESLMESRLTRSNTLVPETWEGHSTGMDAHFHAGGGLNLRGYAGYLAVDEVNGERLLAYKGRSGAAVNMEFEYPVEALPASWKKWVQLNVYWFADAGLIELSHFPDLEHYAQVRPAARWSALRMDMGPGLRIRLLGIDWRADFPIWVNRPPASHPQSIDARFVLGIHRSF